MERKTLRGQLNFRFTSFVLTPLLALYGFMDVALADDKSKIKFEADIATSYRVDSFDWNIAGTVAGTDPNILSELIWSDMIIPQLKLGGSARFPSGFLIKGEISYGKIIEGDNQDSDYLEDDRNGLYSRSNNKAGGDVADGKTAIGFVFRHFDETARRPWSITPLLGYAYHRQNLVMTDGFQTYPPFGAFSADKPLNSSYDTEWYGPWLGADLWLQATDNLAVIVSGEYNWATAYEAKANWNLRDEFAHPVSFTHSAKTASGVYIAFGFEYSLSKQWLISTFFEKHNWKAIGGLDRTFCVDPDPDICPAPVLETRLNQANWGATALTVQTSYRFD